MTPGGVSASLHAHVQGCPALANGIVIIPSGASRDIQIARRQRHRSTARQLVDECSTIQLCGPQRSRCSMCQVHSSASQDQPTVLAVWRIWLCSERGRVSGPTNRQRAEAERSAEQCHSSVLRYVMPGRAWTDLVCWPNDSVTYRVTFPVWARTHTGILGR